MLKNINYSYFAFLGTGVILLLILIGIIMSPEINFFFFFNIGRALSGILFVPFFIYLAKYIKDKGDIGAVKLNVFNLLILISGLITAISLTLGGIFTMQGAPMIHIVAGALFNFGIVFLCFFCGLAEYLIPEVPKKHAISGFIVAPLPIIFMIFFLLSNFMGFSESIMFFFEWLSFFAFIVWIINQGFYSFKRK